MPASEGLIEGGQGQDSQRRSQGVQPAAAFNLPGVPKTQAPTPYQTDSDAPEQFYLHSMIFSTLLL
jgi:hypothetical protein